MSDAMAGQDLATTLLGCCKDGDMGYVSVCMDHFVLDEDGDAVPHEGANGRLGIAGIMEALAEFWPVRETSPDGHILSLSRQLSSIVVGPTGQLRLKCVPTLSAGQVENEFKNFLFRVNQLLKPVGYKLSTCGFNPSAPLAKLPFMPWTEGEPMPWQGMGRLGIGIDYADEQDAVLKLRLASLLAPLLAFVADNAPLVDGEAGASALRCLKASTELCPIHPAGLFDPGYGFAACEGAPCAVRWQEGVLLEVMDALPLGPMMSCVALVKGLFYSPTNIELLAHFLKLDAPVIPWDDQTVVSVIDEIGEKGSGAAPYGRGLDSWVDLLFRLAADGLGTEDGYLESIQEFKAL